MSVTGYPTPGKAKAKLILDAFCAGAGGQVARDTRLRPGGAAFYGVVAETKPLWDQALAEGRELFYLDNAYTDPQRQVYFRATRNRLQHPGTGQSDCKRWDALRIALQPWRTGGRHVLICPQSDQFMRDVVGYPGCWVSDTVARLQQLTDRELRVRPWARDKREWYRTLPADLVDCWALVTFSSASAITAIFNGVPAICTGADCISASMTGALEDIESPPQPQDRRAWAGIVADNQWTLDEFRNGTAWRALCNQDG